MCLTGHSRRHSEHELIAASSVLPATAVAAAVATAGLSSSLYRRSPSKQRSSNSTSGPSPRHLAPRASALLSDRPSLSTGEPPNTPNALASASTPGAGAGEAVDGYGTFEYTSFRDEEDEHSLEHSKGGGTPTRGGGKAPRTARTSRASGSLSPPGTAASGSVLSDASSVQMRAAAMVPSVSRTSDAPVAAASAKAAADASWKVANGAVKMRTRTTSRETAAKPTSGTPRDAAAGRADREKAGAAAGGGGGEVVVESASQPLLIDADGPEDAFDDSEADSVSYMSSSEILLQSRLKRQYHFATNASFDADTLPAPQYSAINPFAPAASSNPDASSRVSTADLQSDSVFSAAPVTNALLQHSSTARSTQRGPRESSSGLSDVVIVCGVLPNSQSFTVAPRTSAASVTPPPPLEPPPPSVPRRSKRRSEMVVDVRRVSGIPDAIAAAVLTDAANRRADSPALSQTSEANASDSGSAKAKWIDFSENPMPIAKPSVASSSRSSISAQQSLVAAAPPAPVPTPPPAAPQSLAHVRPAPVPMPMRRERSELVGAAWERFPSDRAPLDLVDSSDLSASERAEPLHVVLAATPVSPPVSDGCTQRSTGGLGSSSHVARKTLPREGIPNLTFREELTSEQLRSGRSPAHSARISASHSSHALTNPFFDNSNSSSPPFAASCTPRASEPSAAVPSQRPMPLHQIPILPAPPSNKTGAVNAIIKQNAALAKGASASTPDGEQQAARGGIIDLLRSKLRFKTLDATPPPVVGFCTVSTFLVYTLLLSKSSNVLYCTYCIPVHYSQHHILFL